MQYHAWLRKRMRWTTPNLSLNRLMFHRYAVHLLAFGHPGSRPHQALVCSRFPVSIACNQGILLEFLDYVFGQGGPDCGDYLKKSARGNAVVFSNHVFPLERMLGDLLEKVLYVCRREERNGRHYLLQIHFPVICLGEVVAENGATAFVVQAPTGMIRSNLPGLNRAASSSRMWLVAQTSKSCILPLQQRHLLEELVGY